MTAFSTNGAELDILWGEKKLNLSLIPYTKINSKWAMNHLKYKTINLLEKNQRIFWGLAQPEFLDWTPKSQTMEEKIDKFDFSKI